MTNRPDAPWRRIFSLFIPLAFALTVVSVPAVQAQTYTWPGDGKSHLDGSYNFATGIRLTAPANTTEVNIVSSTHEQNGGDIVDTVSVTSGPAPQVGEWIDVSQGFQPGLFQIIAVTLNTDGTYTLVENQQTDEGFPVHSGAAFLGPGLQYILHFNGLNWATATCNSSTSSVDAGYLDASGNLQGAQSNSVTCSNSSTDGGITVVTTGSFTAGSLSVSFTITNKNGRYGRYAQSATWTISQSVAALYPCGSNHLPCKGTLAAITLGYRSDWAQ